MIGPMTLMSLLLTAPPVPLACSAGASEEGREYIEADIARVELREVLDQWQADRGVFIAGAALDALIRDYLSCEYWARLRRPDLSDEDVTRLGYQALRTYLDDLESEAETTPGLGSILGELLGTGGFSFPKRKNWAFLTLELEPPDAKLSVDGKRAHSRLIRVLAGEHRIVAQKQGHVSCVHEIKINGGERKRLSCHLEEIKSQRWAAAPPRGQERRPVHDGEVHPCRGNRAVPIISHRHREKACEVARTS